MADPQVLVIDQFWECPRCGMQFGMGPPAKLDPPTCSMGHSPAEMEQKTAESFRSSPNPEEN